MSQKNIIRAWKDAEYRASLSDAERRSLPDHPAGTIELPDDEMKNIDGGLALAARDPGGVQFVTASWLCNCDNISQAMSATSTCCCFKAAT